MTKKLLALALAALLLAAALPALGEETVMFTDSTGREVEVPADITRIAPTGPMAQMVLLALAPEYFVGIASAWSKEAEEFLGDYYALPVLGQLYGTGSDLNLEELAARDPQVTIDIGEPKSGIAEDMNAIQEQLGIPAVHISAYMSTFGDAYRLLGSLLGLEERAEALAAYCEEAYARTEAIMERVGEDGKVNLLYIVGEEGLSVVAKGSYHAEIIDMLANNLAVVDDPSSKGTGNPVDFEQLLLWDPDVIVFAPDSAYDEVGEDPLWRELTAVQSGRYVETPFGPYNWMGFPPSVQRYLGILWLCDLFYPEACEYDLYEEVARYYALFYHAELSQEQYDRMMANSFFAAE